MIATNVPKEPAFGFRIDLSEQGATSTIELEGEWDLAQRTATTDAIAHALDRRPACLSPCVRRPPDFFDWVSDDFEGVSNAI
jgi:hypothetical protein